MSPLGKNKIHNKRSQNYIYLDETIVLSRSESASTYTLPHVVNTLLGPYGKGNTSVWNVDFLNFFPIKHRLYFGDIVRKIEDPGKYYSGQHWRTKELVSFRTSAILFRSAVDKISIGMMKDKIQNQIRQ